MGIPSWTARLIGLDPKPRPNHHIYLETLRSMSPEQRLAKAFELTELSRSLFLAGLRQRFPDLPESDLKRLYLERLSLCHNSNY